MALSRREKFALKSQLIEILEKDRDWDFRRINLLLGEYGCETLGGYGNEEFSFEDSIRNVPDDYLLEMYSLVTGVEPKEIEGKLATVDSSLWNTGYVRLFVSHSASHKKFVGQVADELAVSGIHAFVAHDTMEYEQPWQDQIEEALQSMQAFVAIIHPEFLDSPWCQQEVGWAMGRGVPKYALRLPADPSGFIGRTQWPQASGLNHKEVAKLIISWVSRIPEFSDQIVEGLLASLGAAENYLDAGATASRIATIDTLTAHQWETLAKIYHSNDQVARASVVSRELAPFYRKHAQTWPPAEPSQADPL